jgi:hypothetical protein
MVLLTDSHKRTRLPMRAWSLGLLLLFALAALSQATSVGQYAPSETDAAPSGRPVRYVHAAAGFEADIPGDWAIQVFSAGLELSKSTALLAIDYLQIEQGESREVLSLMVGSQTSDVDDFSRPYPGLRTSLEDQGYAAEVAVFKTPVGFYLVSLEQTGTTDPSLVMIFEKVLASFNLLGTPPFDYTNPGMQFVDLGPIAVAIPPGMVTRQTGSLFWKNTAGGILTAEIVRHDRTASLRPLIEGWEQVMLSAETGLTQRRSLYNLRIDGRRSLRADYTGDDTRAGLIATEVAPGKILLLSLIAKQASFASHLSLLDAASFSVADPSGEERHIVEDNGFDTPETFSSLASSHGSANDLNKSDRKIYNQLRSNDPDKIRQAAKYLYKGRYQNKSLLDTAAYVLEAGYRKQPSNTHVDAMAWICKALGNSSQKKYQPLLKQVASGAPSRKLKGYADKASRRLH